MPNYLQHLQDLYSPDTFRRKIDYIAYNFASYVKPAKDILEIGPGLGEFVTYVNSFKTKNIDIFDNDMPTLKYLKAQLRVRNVYFGKNIQSIDKQLKLYDMIFLTQVFEHLPKADYRPFLTTLYAHLNHGGVIIMTVPNGGNPLGLVERYFDLTHEAAFTENSLNQLVNYCDLNNYTVKIQGYRIPPSDIINLSRIFLQTLMYFFMKIIYLINGGIYATIFNPNITVIIRKG